MTVIISVSRLVSIQNMLNAANSVVRLFRECRQSEGRLQRALVLNLQSSSFLWFHYLHIVMMQFEKLMLSVLLEIIFFFFFSLVASVFCLVYLTDAV